MAFYLRMFEDQSLHQTQNEPTSDDFQAVKEGVLVIIRSWYGGRFEELHVANDGSYIWKDIDEQTNFSSGVVISNVLSGTVESAPPTQPGAGAGAGAEADPA